MRYTTESQLISDMLTASKARLAGPFAYWGEVDLVTWAWTPVGVSRDSDRIDRHNWTTILAELESKYPDDLIVDHCSHSLCGWVDHLAIRIRREDDSIPEIVTAMLDILNQVDDYPIYDELGYSDLEYEEINDSLFESVKYTRGVDLTEDQIWDVLDWIQEHDHRLYDRAWEREYLDHPVAVQCAAFALGYLPEEESDLPLIMDYVNHLLDYVR